MPVLKTYDFAETKAAIDRANYRHINTLKMVRSDISVTDWGKPKIKPKKRDSSLPENLQWPGRRDAGHVFRHVEDTREAGKSYYADEHTAISVTSQLLNSTQGQAALAALDGESRELYDNTTRRVTAAVSGDWYGCPGGGTARQKISRARCELMKLGNDILWVHSSYPNRFQTT